jgi:hypothetical protein
MQDSGDNQLVVGRDALRRHAWREAFERRSRPTAGAHGGGRTAPTPAAPNKSGSR